jgi:hypothetical protein
MIEELCSFINISKTPVVYLVLYTWYLRYIVQCCGLYLLFEFETLI